MSIEIAKKIIEKNNPQTQWEKRALDLNLVDLAQVLKTSTYLTNHHEPTVADAILFLKIQDLEHSSLKRWYDLMQHHYKLEKLKIEVPLFPEEQTQLKKSEPKKEKKEKKEELKVETNKIGFMGVPPCKLDLRVGRITKIEKHPGADKMYVESIDLGTEQRTVVSGLVDHVPKDELQNRLVVVVCNLKPANKRGITSEGMVLCSSKETIELLDPPSDSNPGDKLFFEHFQGEPEVPLNQKRKTWEQISQFLKTNLKGEAGFQANDVFCRLLTEKGVIKPKTHVQSSLN